MPLSLSSAYHFGNPDGADGVAVENHRHGRANRIMVARGEEKAKKGDPQITQMNADFKTGGFSVRICVYLRNLRITLFIAVGRTTSGKLKRNQGEERGCGHAGRGGVEVLSKTRKLPALRHLDLSFNWCSWDYPDQASWVRALLKGRLVGQRESLWLRSTDLEDTGAELLANSKLVRTLRHLNLSGNRIGEAGLRALATSTNFQSLAILDRRDNIYDYDGPD